MISICGATWSLGWGKPCTSDEPNRMLMKENRGRLTQAFNIVHDNCIFAVNWGQSFNILKVISSELTLFGKHVPAGTMLLVVSFFTCSCDALICCTSCSRLSSLFSIWPVVMMAVGAGMLESGCRFKLIVEFKTSQINYTNINLSNQFILIWSLYSGNCSLSSHFP